jgi:hypothetical protein
MRRRIILSVALLANAALAACSNISAPTSKSDDCSGYMTSDGRCLPCDPADPGCKV